jgi:hypothetical protein
MIIAEFGGGVEGKPIGVNRGDRIIAELGGGVEGEPIGVNGGDRIIAELALRFGEGGGGDADQRGGFGASVHGFGVKPNSSKPSESRFGLEVGKSLLMFITNSFFISNVVVSEGR